LTKKGKVFLLFLSKNIFHPLDPYPLKKQLLLLVIYLAFISLGLPDSVLGSAWPAMFGDLQVPVEYAGLISMIVAAGTVVSSLMSGKVIRYLR
jgi:hypothetical protein